MDNNFYAPENQGDYALFEVGDLPLENGETLRGAKLAYRTYGALNANKDNAVLITTWFSGTGKVMADVYVGNEHTLNPDEYFIIIVDQFGAGTSSSPNNTPAPQNKAKFPDTYTSDDVRAQHKLVTEKFGITQLALVFGGSMGGQQVYEWAIRYPDMMKYAAVVACTAKISLHQTTYTRALENAVQRDPHFKKGWYEDGRDVRDGIDHMAEIIALLGWSPQFYQEERWRSVLGMSSHDDFIKGVMKAYFEPMDPNALIAQMRKWGSADVSKHTDGDLPKALGKIKAKMLVMPISHDLSFPPHEAEQDCAHINNATYKVIESKEGHFGLNGFEPGYMAQVNEHLKTLLKPD